MRREVNELIKTIGIYNLIIGCIVSLGLSFFFGKKSMLFLLAIELGFINLIINSWTIQGNVNKKEGITFLKVVLFLMIRLLLISGPAIILFTKSEVSFFIFISGYISQIFSITYYGTKLKGRKVM